MAVAEKKAEKYVPVDTEALKQGIDLCELVGQRRPDYRGRSGYLKRTIGGQSSARRL